MKSRYSVIVGRSVYNCTDLLAAVEKAKERAVSEDNVYIVATIFDNEACAVLGVATDDANGPRLHAFGPTLKEYA